MQQKKDIEMKKIIPLTLFPLLLIITSCSSLLDPTRCDNSGCEYRKDGYYLMKKYPQMGGAHRSGQTGWNSSEHAFRGKEFCSIGCANEYYKKL